MSARRHREARIFKIIRKEASGKKKASQSMGYTPHKAKSQRKEVRTPGARNGVVDGRIDVPEVDLAHEAIDLRHTRMSDRVAGNHHGHQGRTDTQEVNTYV